MDGLISDLIRRGESSEEADQILVKLRQIPSKEDRTRVENLQLAVTTVIISVYLSSVSAGNPIFPQGYPLRLVTVVPSLFLIGKLTLATLRPFYDNIWLKRVDFVLLPFLFAGSFLGSGGLLFATLVEIPTPVLGVILSQISEFVRAYLYKDRLINLYTLLIIVSSGWYAWRSGKSMSVIESGVPEVRFTFTSGSSDSSLPLRIENPTANQIDPTNVEIEIWTESGIEVTDIDGARRVNDRVWQPYMPIQPDAGMTLEMQIQRTEGRSEISESSATVEVRLDGLVQQRHRVLLEG
ncbi:hypothetical protein [Halogeometricum pallidum]|uniref:hypothetical protein n=1 Tax=Halogeometricum pallidum TaxID=411361 RepID=UPI0012697549|nr:hypothetical protein [Halogeometricum pallidum]